MEPESDIVILRQRCREFYHRLANDIVAALSRGDRSALERLGKFAGQSVELAQARAVVGSVLGSGPDDSGITLDDARRFVARMNGFDAWDSMYRAIDWAADSRPITLRRIPESPEDSSLTIREATVADIPKLVPLHLTTWRATYEGLMSPEDLNGPTYAIRERQWRASFAVRDGSHFTYVVERADGELVGFANGRFDLKERWGELNKIYLMREYHRQGLGARLVCLIARRLADNGLTRMWVAADGRNAACRFYEALGARLTIEQDGRVTWGHYHWPDLRLLVEACADCGL